MDKVTRDMCVAQLKNADDDKRGRGRPEGGR